MDCLKQILQLYICSLYLRPLMTSKIKNVKRTKLLLFTNDSRWGRCFDCFWDRLSDSSWVPLCNLDSLGAKMDLATNVLWAFWSFCALSDARMDSVTCFSLGMRAWWEVLSCLLRNEGVEAEKKGKKVQLADLVRPCLKMDECRCCVYSPSSPSGFLKPSDR